MAPYEKWSHNRNGEVNDNFILENEKPISHVLDPSISDKYKWRNRKKGKNNKRKETKRCTHLSIVLEKILTER